MKAGWKLFVEQLAGGSTMEAVSPEKQQEEEARFKKEGEEA